MFDANVRGTARVLDAAIEANVPRIVYVSSVVAFGDTEGATVDRGPHAPPPPLLVLLRGDEGAGARDRRRADRPRRAHRDGPARRRLRPRRPLAAGHHDPPGRHRQAEAEDAPRRRLPDGVRGRRGRRHRPGAGLRRDRRVLRAGRRVRDHGRAGGPRRRGGRPQGAAGHHAHAADQGLGAARALRRADDGLPAQPARAHPLIRRRDLLRPRHQGPRAAGLHLARRWTTACARPSPPTQPPRLPRMRSMASVSRSSAPSARSGRSPRRSRRRHRPARPPRRTPRAPARSTTPRCGPRAPGAHT